MIVVTDAMIDAADKAVTLLPTNTKAERHHLLKVAITAAFESVPMEPVAYTAKFEGVDLKGTKSLLQFPLYHVPYAFPIPLDRLYQTCKRSMIEELVFNNRQFYFGMKREAFIEIVNSEKFTAMFVGAMLQSYTSLLTQVNTINQAISEPSKCGKLS